MHRAQAFILGLWPLPCSLAQRKDPINVGTMRGTVSPDYAGAGASPRAGVINFGGTSRPTKLHPVPLGVRFGNIGSER